MAEAHLDHPGEITWFKSRGPVEIVGPCPHVECEHMATAVIAWGPDMDHYTLDHCLGCGCRAWQSDRCLATTEWLQPLSEPEA